MDIQVTKTGKSKIGEIDFNNLPFGKYFTDHMLEVDYKNGEWKTVMIKPYQPLSLSPALAALHYGQAIFEGIKAYKDREGNPFIFRPYDNFKRFNISAARMRMPEMVLPSKTVRPVKPQPLWRLASKQRTSRWRWSSSL